MMEKREINLDHPAYPKYATVYSDKDTEARACILYFHGGGLLYGRRDDLPLLHIRTLTRAGYIIISFDYPLAPAAKLDTIIGDVCSSITHYVKHPELYCGQMLPFFLWGRSAGAYLCLMAAARPGLPLVPAGILSYYGYGFLCDNWFQTPSGYYKSLPAVDASCLEQAGTVLRSAGGLDTHYAVYVYARQTGTWRSLLYEGRDKYFYLDYTLRACTALPCPLFCAHSTRDNDVPYAEFLELSNRFHPRQFIASCGVHDFDRDEENPFTKKLLDETLVFLDQTLKSRESDISSPAPGK